MNATETIVATVEGPNGTAEVIEVQGAGNTLEYRTRFKGATDTYKSMGEAYIEAKQRAGVKN
jgi:hypothetical protein